MSESLQLNLFESEPDLNQSPSYLEDSPVNLFPWLESKKEKKTTVTYGRKCSELSESLRRVGLSVRTYLESCELPLTTFAMTWSVRATTSGYLILKLRLSEHRTGETDSSLWRTPGAEDAVGRGEYKAPEKIKKRWEKHQVLLCQQVKLWPTPRKEMAHGFCESRAKDLKTAKRECRLEDVVEAAERMLPTPTANRWDGLQSHGTNVVSGQLNPTWVEWLMGFPFGWTDLNA